jgi:uncharacterized protein (DUF1778 family)
MGSAQKAAKTARTGRIERNAPKSARIDLRATYAEQKLMQLGAERRGEKFSQFVIKSACNEARAALADQKHFELSPSQFAHFTEALDRPAKVIPALQKLFAEPSVLER